MADSTLSQNDKQKLEDNMNTHHTCIPVGQAVQLKKCDKINCNCQNVHCPFCDIDHFRPAKPTRVRDHLELKHFAHAVQFNDFLIVKCFTKCGDKPACHYHCPVCHTKILKRKAFTKHMKGHAVNMKMGSVAVMAPDDKTPQKIVAYDEVSDTIEIELCTDTCPDTSGAHFHCPFCEKTSSDRSMIVIHLWRCKDLKSIDLKKDELKGDNPFFPVEGIVHPKDNPDIKWHKSIVRNLNDLPLTPCDRSNCCGGKYHCDLCEIDKFQPAFHVHASVHQMSHWRKRTTIGDYAVLPCFLSCEIAQGSTIQLRSHYHCPVCGESRRRRTGFLHHIKICQGTRYDTLRYAMAKSQKLKEMFENGDGLNVDETTAVTEKLNRDVVTEEEPSNHQSDTLADNFGSHQFDTLTDNSDLQPVENFQFETKPSSPPIPLMESVELQPDINKTEHRESDKTIEEIDLSKVEIFEQVTAKITEGLLRAVGSDKMTSILEETASSIGVAYSSSPGVTSAVYNVTGELEQLVEVKKAIRKIICRGTWTDEVESSSFIENSGTGDISSNNVTDKDEADIQPVEGDQHNSKLKRRKSKRKVTSSRSAVDLETDSKLKKARTKSQDKGSNIEHVSQSKRGKEKSKKEKANIPPAERETDVKVKRYSTRGIKVDFASLLSGKEQNRNMVTCKGRQSNAQTSDKKGGKNEQDNSDECNIRDDKFSEEHENIGEKSLQDRDVDDEDDSGDDDKDDNDDDDDNDFQLDTDNDSDFELSSKKKQRKKSAVISCVNDDGGNVAYIPPVIFVGVKVQKRKFRQGIRGKTKDHKQNSFETSIELKKSSNGIISEPSCDKGTAADDRNDDIAEITLNAEKKINKITETDGSGTNACDMMSFKRKGVKKFVCRHCGSQCCDFVSLTSHLKVEHQDMETWRCDVCEREFNKEYHLDRHLVLKHGPMEERADITGRFVCKICIKSFYNEISLAKHTVKMHSAGEKELNILQKSKEEEYVMCEVCGKRFITSSHLQVHKQAIHQPQSFSCDICGKSFSHTRYLQSHIKRHKGDKKKECPTCGVRFVDSNTLRAHMETHKNPEDRVYNYICSYCGKKHNNKSFHLDHINKHTGNRPHACQICSRTFAFRSALSKHMFYIHSTEKPFKCTYCDKAFKLKRLLENHIVTHTGESSYVCEKCNKSFSCNYTLKQHNRKCKSVIMTSDLAQRLGVTFVVTSAPNFSLEPSSNNVESSILLNPGQMKEQQVISLPLQESMETASDVIEVVSSLGNQNSLPPHDSNVKEPSGQDMTGEPEAEVYVCSECNASFVSLAVAEEHVLTSHMDLTDIEHEVDQSIQLEDLETVRVILTGENTIETGEQGQ